MHLTRLERVMNLSSVYLLQPTIWLPRAELDRLRAAEARERGEDEGRRDALACEPRAAVAV